MESITMRSTRICIAGSFMVMVLSAALASAQISDIDTLSLDHAVYLVGDLQYEPGGVPKTLALMRNCMRSDAASSRTVVFLGDNAGPSGYRNRDGIPKDSIRAWLKKQIDLEDISGSTVLHIPGDKDWDQGRKNGFKAVKLQEKLVDRDVEHDPFRPDKGCPGPEDQNLGEHGALIILDTQWWLQSHRRGEGEKDGCDASTEAEVLLQLKDKLRDARHKRIIVVGHHPLVSYGNRGGFFGFKDHLFPLTRIHSKLYVPLPGIGSLYPLGRKLYGDDQDLSHVHYRTMRKALMKEFNQYSNLIYASAHEHSLQLTHLDSIHHIVAGSGERADYLRQNRDLEYGSMHRGFSRVDIMSDGSSYIHFFTLDESLDPAFTKKIAGPLKMVVQEVEAEEKNQNELYDKPDSVHVQANSDLAASRLHQTFFGRLHRESWTQEITVPVVDLSTLDGGLTPIELGGGKQTRSLKLKNNVGHEFSLRTIRKYPGLALDPDFRDTFVEDIVSDGIAASNPYSALVIPPLAEAVAVYHTNPRLYYVLRDTNLGKFSAQFDSTFCLYEERPDGDWSEAHYFGNSENIISSSDLIEEIRDSYHSQIDEEAMVRARLFDIIIGDWDRHDDQWRWAEFEEGKDKIYRPIPRDRDQAFFTVDGVIPTLANRTWGARMLQEFGPEVRDVKGQNHSAQAVDHAYLSGLDWDEWSRIVTLMQSELTDSVIQQSVFELPEPIRKISGHFIVEGLKGRRERLPEIAKEFYEDISKIVDVVGTDNDDYFEVVRLDDRYTSVKVFDREDDDKVRDRCYYDRTFDRHVTKEIRMYGLEGNDEFDLRGEVNKGIKIRLIAGFEDDEIRSHSRVKGPSQKTVIYETEDNDFTIDRTSRDTRLDIRPAHEQVDYERKDHAYDTWMPLLRLGLNPDDSFFLGGGFSAKLQGFDSDDYKWSHRFTTSYAWSSAALDVQYAAQVNKIFGKTGLGMEFELKAPEYNLNFFGFGNSTDFIENEELYRYELDIIQWSPFLHRTFNDLHHVKFGPTLYLAGTQLLSTPSDQEQETSVRNVTYLGLATTYSFDHTDTSYDPYRGMRFSLEMDVKYGHHNDEVLQGVEARLSTFLPLRIWPGRSVVGLRLGGGHRSGNIDPTQAMRLGGDFEMRGLRRGRFSGHTNAFVNTDLRADVFHSSNGAIPFRLGLLALADAGRVWSDNKESAIIHYAIGGGVYISPLDLFIIQASYSQSDDDHIIDMRLGFFF